jgi:hypothetical protein
MSTSVPNPAPVPRATPSGLSLRLRGVALFVLLIVEVLLGSQLARLGNPYPTSYLAAHVGLGIVLIGFSGHLLWSAVRSGRAAATSSAALTCLATVGAVVSGFVFLFGGQSAAALLSMEALGVVALIGSVLVIVLAGAGSLAPSAPGTASS